MSDDNSEIPPDAPDAADQPVDEPPPAEVKPALWVTELREADQDRIFRRER